MHGGVLDAPDLNRRLAVREAGDGDPLARIVRLALQAIGVQGEPDLTITVTSTVPIARGWAAGQRCRRPSCGRWRTTMPVVLVARHL